MVQVRTWWRVNRWLLLGALLVGVAVYAGLRFLATATEKVTAPPPTVPVFVLKTALPADTEIQAGDVGIEDLPVGTVPPGVLTTDPVGYWTSEALPADVPLVSADVFAPATSDILSVRIPRGDVAMDVSLGAASAVDGVIAPGDRVGFLVTVPASPKGPARTELFLAQVLVLAVDGSLTGQPTPGAGEALIVAVTPQQAEALQFAEDQGTVTAVLEPPGARLSPGGSYGAAWPTPP
jgi:Flp pilus assembly protein CpaB